MNVVLADHEHGGLLCSCGASCKPGETKRFRRRHPEKCSARRAFAQQLAAGTKSVDAPTFKPFRNDRPMATGTNIAYQIEAIQDEGQGLTDWEAEFIPSIAEQFERTGELSERQQQILARIYDERTIAP